MDIEGYTFVFLSIFYICDFTFQPQKSILKMHVKFISWNLIKGKHFYTLLPPFNMNIK